MAAANDYPETVTCGEAAELIAWRVAEWQAEPRELDETLNFAYHATRWVYDVFGKAAVHYSGSEIEGSELPDSLKPLVRHSWRDEDVFTGENRIRLLPVPEHEYIEPVIPGWDEIKTSLVSFEDQFNHIAANPDVLSGIKPGKFVLTDKMHVQFEPAYYHSWGLDFYITADELEVVPYGKSGHTRSALKYVMGYQDRPHVAANTVMDLAVLAARHATDYHRVELPFERVAAFDHRLMGLSPVEITPDDVSEIHASPGSAMMNLMIGELVKRGKLPFEERGTST